MGRAPSILQNEKESYISGQRYGLECHHIFFGSLRKVSDSNGFWVWLNPEEHRGTWGVHGRDGHGLDIELKRACQRKYEETHSREEFMRLIGMNFLED